MKRFLVIFAVLSLTAGAAYAQFDYANEIGIYTTATPTGDPADILIDAGGVGAGGFDCFVIITNPTDEGTGNPIATLGGFEFSVTYPAGWNFVVTLPAGVLDLDSAASHFYCSGAIPVSEFTVLSGVQFGSWGGASPGGIFLTPYSNGEQSIPGHMAVTDADNNFVLSTAFPISGSYDAPVAGITLEVVPTEDVSWGSVKSLFQ